MMASVTTLPKRNEIPKDQTWELESIYPTDADWERDFAQVSAQLPEIRAFEGRLGESAEILLAALQLRDAANETLGRLVVYATMRMHEDSANSTYQALADRATTLANDLNAAGAYFTPEILALPQAQVDSFFARAHHYESALESALDPNNIPVSVYHNLVATVEANLPRLTRYLTLRKRLLGLDELHMFDLYVPMVREVEYKVAFNDAQEQVARALAPLGAGYVSALRTGFASRWIDVLESEGKRSGAYSWGTYGTYPFVLLNYQESMDSMFTLAHEMGHAMHSYFTWQTQPFPYSSYTLFVAEVASTLNEALLIHYLLQNTDDKALRMYIINHAQRFVVRILQKVVEQQCLVER